MATLSKADYRGLPLRSRVTCPHCWAAFSPDQALWIAQHPDLIGDPRLGPDEPQRFLPTRFDVAGGAIDAKGFACHELACPRCHLSIPRAMLQMEASFLSILGAPACGKTYFLASMTWRMRTSLPRDFALAFADADTSFNHYLNEYESQQFLSTDPDRPVFLDKTEEQGHLYDTVLFDEQAVNYLRPFVFTLKPLELHPHANRAAAVSKVLCLYDNAGESFLPGQDTAARPVTRHLALSDALLFLFDPTQDVRFRRACPDMISDPEMAARTQHSDRQETVLQEAAQRVRRYAGLAENAQHKKPLIVVVTKCDCWLPLLEMPELPLPFRTLESGAGAAVRLGQIEQVSAQLRALLVRLTPEIVAAAESFAAEVLYIPVSATGCSPTWDAQIGKFCFRPRDLDPLWVEVPLLCLMSRWMRGLVSFTAAKNAPSVAGDETGGAAAVTPRATPPPTKAKRVPEQFRDPPHGTEGTS